MHQSFWWPREGRYHSDFLTQKTTSEFVLAIVGCQKLLHTIGCRSTPICYEIEVRTPGIVRLKIQRVPEWILVRIPLEGFLVLTFDINHNFKYLVFEFIPDYYWYKGHTCFFPFSLNFYEINIVLLENLLQFPKISL